MSNTSVPNFAIRLETFSDLEVARIIEVLGMRPWPRQSWHTYVRVVTVNGGVRMRYSSYKPSNIPAINARTIRKIFKGVI